MASKSLSRDQLERLIKTLDEASLDPSKQRILDQKLMFAVAKTCGTDNDVAADLVAELVIGQAMKQES